MIQSAQPIRVAIYARYSSDLQSPTSIEDQVRLCRQHAARQDGWTVVQVFEDVAISGAMAGLMVIGIIKVFAGEQLVAAAIESGEALGAFIETEYPSPR